MAYTAVPTVTTGELWTAANQNTYLRDNMAATLPAVLSRQGGSATLWTNTGTTDYDAPNDVLVQCGSAAWAGAAALTGQVTVTYPTAFSYKPLVWGMANFDGVNKEEINITLANSLSSAVSGVLNWKGLNNQTAVDIYWLAIGPV